MKTKTIKTLTVTGLVAASLALPAFAQDFNARPEDVNKQEKNYSPGVGQNFPLRVFWGDTHLHTSYSTDAGMFGTTLGPEEAYRFARGEEVVSNNGLKAKLRRPLDFLVVADHAEVLGLAPPRWRPGRGNTRARPGRRTPARAGGKAEQAGTQLLAGRRPELPPARVLGRHAPAHGLFLRRRHARHHARAGGCLPFRARRGGHLHHR